MLHFSDTLGKYFLTDLEIRPDSKHGKS